MTKKRYNGVTTVLLAILTLLICSAMALFTSGITTARAETDTVSDTFDFSPYGTMQGNPIFIPVSFSYNGSSESVNMSTSAVNTVTFVKDNVPTTFLAISLSKAGQNGFTAASMDCLMLLGTEQYTGLDFSCTNLGLQNADSIFNYKHYLLMFNIPHFKSLSFDRLQFDVSDALSLPEQPTKEGHHFVGWYLDEALTQPYTGQEITEDMTFYAKFEVNTYTVTLDSNGGNHIPALSVEWNTAAQIPEPTRVGYNFLGWFMSDGTEYNGQAVTQDMTLTAKWQIKTYTVTFKVDGEIYKTLEVTHGTTFKQAMASVKELRYMNLLNAAGEKISKEAQITEDTDAPVAEMTPQEKQAEFLSRNMWLVWTLVGLAGAGLLSSVIASLVAYKRR